MTEVVHTHDTHHAPPPPRTGLRRLTGPGYLRAAWLMSLFWAVGFGLVVFFRWLGGYDPLLQWLSLIHISEPTRPY